MKASGNIVISHTTSLSFWLSPLARDCEYRHCTETPLLNRTYTSVGTLPEAIRNLISTVAGFGVSDICEGGDTVDSCEKQNADLSAGASLAASVCGNSCKPTVGAMRSFGDAHIHLLGHEGYRDRTGAIVGHACRYELPGRSFVKIKTGPYKEIYMSGPELSLVQSVSMLSVGQFLFAAYQLCGSSPTFGNIKWKNSNEKYSNKRIAPLTSRRKIESFAERAPGLQGTGKTSKLLQYVTDNSWSPRESMLAIHLVLPYRYGGYGLPLPKMNCKVGLSDYEKHAAQKNHFFLDLYWPEHSMAVEYDSDKYHLSSKGKSLDSNRSAVLSHMGIDKIGITTSQFNDLVEFDKMARIISRKLGKRINPRRSDFLEKSVNLRRELLAPIPDNIWMHS